LNASLRISLKARLTARFFCFESDALLRFALFMCRKGCIRLTSRGLPLTLVSILIN
jgi:hypothetical protein